MRWIIPFTVAGLAAVGSADPEVFDLGKLDQYMSKEGEAGTLSGNTIWLSGTDEDENLRMTVSDDVKAKIQGVLEGCGQLDDKCYHEVRQVLRSANVEVNKKLEARHFGHLLSKTFKTGAGVFLSFADYLYTSWWARYNDFNNVSPNFIIPKPKASEVEKVASATEVVVSAEGASVAKITPTPDPTSAQGPVPSVTSVTTAHDEYKQGDLDFMMDEGLAGRMQEIMARSKDCEDGSKFDREHPSKRRASSRLGKAICAYRAVTINMGTTLRDLTYTNFDGLVVKFAGVTEQDIAAWEYVQGITEDFAAIYQLQRDRAIALGATIFVAALGAVEDTPIDSNNKIAADLIQVSKTQTGSQTSTSGCPDPEKTPLLCAWGGDEENDHCDVVMPSEEGGEAKCSPDGEFADCPCNTPAGVVADYADETEQTAVKKFTELYKQITIPEPKPEPQPEPPKGPTKALTIIADWPPWNLQTMRDGSANKVWWNFFATDYGKTIDCRNDPARYDAVNLDRIALAKSKKLVYPGGEFPMKLFDQDCTYKNSGDNVGKLFCGDKAIECFWDPNNTPREGEREPRPEDMKQYPCPGKDGWLRHAVFTCPW
ncbi:uncharacterized protein EI97DRAFT_287071 [Westerdykella ornata]|uniref:Uncharacterized protein n=1 Tax=Westerdykella ornata TaxID=318751 RepID=A0A6A6J4H1_WESOR|nr:uncharacterized protein EI97DRAFT_287071 [Westerdykella ornata]KAF2271292.1 hypothetical protein EI97DRAFT_287071 [Westerdykella ornata]